MKIRFIKTTLVLVTVLLALLIGGIAAYAGPALQIKIELTQPTGQKFKATPRGDEKFSWMLAETGEVIAKGKDNYWYYAVLNNGKVLPGTARYKVDSKPFSVVKDADVVKIQKSKITAASVGSKYVKPLSIANTSEKALVLLINFTDIKIKNSDDTWSNQVFGMTGKTVNNYYNEVSNGSFRFSPAQENMGTSNDGVIRVELPYAHPNTGGKDNLVGFQQIQDAIAAANDYIDFSSFDTNGDGTISSNELNIIGVMAGYEAAMGVYEKSVWAHKSSLYWTNHQIFDGKNLNGLGYVTLGEIQGWPGSEYMATIGVMVHELGHNLGLPDLYDYDGSSSGVGIHSLMASGSWGSKFGERPGDTPTHLDAWSKTQLGFVNPTFATGTESFKVNAASTGNYNVIKVPTSVSSQYFLIENRQVHGYDEGLGSEVKYGGIAIWHIDENMFGNDDETHKLVDLEEANEGILGFSQLDKRNDLLQEKDGLYNFGYAHYYSSDSDPIYRNTDTFSPTTKPSSALYGDKGTVIDSGITIVSPDKGADIMTVNVSIPTPVLAVLEQPVIKSKEMNALGGIVNVKGWVLDPDGVSKIDIMFEDKIVGQARYGVERPDIAALYPTYNNVNCGFEYSLDTTKLQNGYYNFKVVMTDNKGKTRELVKAMVIVNNKLDDIGEIEQPKSGETIGGYYNVTGWYLDAGTTIKTELLIDGKVVEATESHAERPDIKEKYPQYSDYYPGFTLGFDTSFYSEGPHTISVRATDVDNNATELPTVNVNIVNKSIVKDIDAAPDIFMPNGTNTVKISFNLTKDATVTADIYDKQGTIIRSLAYVVSKKQGENYITWDGKDKKGSIIEGTFTIVVAATSIDGESGMAKVDVNVIKAKTLAITNVSASPNPLTSAKGKSVAIKYTLSDNTKNVNIKIYDSSKRLVRTLVNSAQTAGSKSVTWDIKNNSKKVVGDGTYTYKINATDTKGKAAKEVSGTVTINMQGPVISGASASGGVISPKSTTSAVIKYSLSENAKVTVQIYSKSTLVRTIASKVSQNKGKNSVKWDGKNNSKKAVSAGTYTYKITAVDGAGNNAKAVSGSVSIKVNKK